MHCASPASGSGHSLPALPWNKTLKSLKELNTLWSVWLPQERGAGCSESLLWGQANCFLLAVPLFHPSLCWPWARGPEPWDLTLWMPHIGHHVPSQPRASVTRLGRKLTHGTCLCCAVLQMPAGSTPQVKKKKQHSANKSIKAFSVCCWIAPVPRSQPACPPEYRAYSSEV